MKPDQILKLANTFVLLAVNGHYKYDQSVVDSILEIENDPEGLEDFTKQYGVIDKSTFEIIPLDILPNPAVWEKDKLVKIKKALENNIALPPIRVTKENGKYRVTDGIHRLFESREFGYTSIPAIVKEYIPV